jgi:hypothetical protein
MINNEINLFYIFSIEYVWIQITEFISYFPELFEFPMNFRIFELLKLIKI